MFSLDDLDPDQRLAATAPRGPVCILAGAGTGKTRTITYRIAHLIAQGFVSPNRVLAVTFTARAAGEMRHRLNMMGIGGVQARTFHAAARRQLQYFWPQVAGDLPWRLLDNKFPLVGRAARSVGVESTTENVRDLLSEIEWAKASLVTADMYAERVAQTKRTPPVTPDKVAEVYRRYEAMKTTDEGMLLDFDDLLLHTVRLWWTSIRTSPHCNSACWRRGWGNVMISPWWGTPTRPFIRSRVRPRSTYCSFPGRIRTQRSHACRGTTVRRLK